MSLFDPDLFDNELFDVGFTVDVSAPTISGLTIAQFPGRSPFVFLVVGYAEIRGAISDTIRGDAMISRSIGGGLQASVEAIVKFSEGMSVDSFVLPDDAPADVWGRMPAETWEKLLERKS
jgi:hypothetical protein